MAYGQVYQNNNIYGYSDNQGSHVNYTQWSNWRYPKALTWSSKLSQNGTQAAGTTSQGTAPSEVVVTEYPPNFIINKVSPISKSLLDEILNNATAIANNFAIIPAATANPITVGNEIKKTDNIENSANTGPTQGDHGLFDVILDFAMKLSKNGEISPLNISSEEKVTAQKIENSINAVQRMARYSNYSNVVNTGYGQYSNTYNDLKTYYTNTYSNRYGNNSLAWCCYTGYSVYQQYSQSGSAATPYTVAYSNYSQSYGNYGKSN